MFRFVSEKAVSALLTLFGASIIAFVILRAVPTNPARERPAGSRRR